MTDADKIAALEAQLELARADLDEARAEAEHQRCRADTHAIDLRLARETLSAVLSGREVPQ